MRQRPDFGKDEFIERCLEVISHFGKVVDVEGRVGKPPEQVTVDNAVRFLKDLPKQYRDKFVPEQELSTTPYGTIVLDFYNRKYFVSVEIGLTQMGYFSELPSGRNYMLELGTIDGNDKNMLAGLGEVFGC